MSRKKIIEIASAEIGTKENPANSNKTKYGNWYGFDGYAWCAQFVSWVYHFAGHPLGKIDDAKGYRACQSGYQFFRRNNQITSKPQEADIVLFDWKGDGHADHTGIFHSWIKEGSTFKCIEGNTAFGNDSDGGAVMLRERNVQSVKAFVSPAILGGAITPESINLTKGDKGSKVVALQKMLYDLGYSITVDGDFGNETLKIVKLFQADSQLVKDGIVSPALIGMLEQALIKTNVADHKLTTGAFLKKGDVGASVLALQNALKKAGYELIADGVFGKATTDALKVYQQKNGLQVDGIAGPQTLSKLKIKM
jgi:peptidoglycan hydrolase-like protein with peptidoglycan-binding domain